MSATALSPVTLVDFIPGGSFYTVGLDGARTVFVPTYLHFQGRHPAFHETYLSEAGYVDEVMPHRPYNCEMRKPLSDEDMVDLRLQLMYDNRRLKKEFGYPFKIK